MIKYNENTINDWNFGDDNIIKVYKHGAVCYYKITSGDTPTPVQEPCFAVVDNISQYSDTEFEDVFNKADGKWYKLNNLNQYEQYGVYGSGRASCEGSSRLPQGYTEVEYIENTGTTSSNGAYLNLGLPLYNIIGNSFVITSRLKSEYYSASGYDVLETIINSESVSSPYYGFVYRYAYSTHNIELASNPSNHATLSTTANTDGTTSLTISCNSTSVTDQVPLGLFASYNTNYNTPYRFSKATIYSLTVVKNGDTVRDLVPAKRDSDSVYGLYDLITDTFYTSPNGNNFIGGEPVTPTDCVTTYDGKLTIDGDYEYIYSGGSWVNVGEVSGSTATLPNVPFVLNYNAKNYDATTHRIAMTTGQLNDTDAIAYNNPRSIVDHSADGYISISESSMQIRKTGQDISLFNRQSDSTHSDLTIVTKAKTTSNDGNIITNRDSDYNWMYRQYGVDLTLHGQGETGYISCSSSNPDILSVRTYYDNGTKVKYNNWTQNTSTTPIDFYYGGINYDGSNAGALFVGYGWTNSNEQWSGDFYWVYMAQANLTDAQIQQVIDYNEGGSQTVYPMYYTVMQDPPDNVSFSSMTEAESYECPWVGITADIDGTDYIFDENYDWVTKYQWVTVSGYICVGTDKYTKTEKQQRNVDDTWASLGVYEPGELIESASTDCQNFCDYNFCGVDANGNDVTINNGTTTLARSNWSSPYPVEGIVGDATTTIGKYCFQDISETLTALTIGNTVTTIEHEAFMETSLLTTLTIPSSVTQIDFWAFTRCYGLNEVIFEGTTPPTFTNENDGVFHDYCPSVIYVPNSAVSAYRAIDGSVWTNESWSTNIIQPISNRT